MARKKKKTGFSSPLLLICIISGIATLVLRMVNRRLQISELGEVAGYAGTAFVVTLLIIIGIWVVRVINRR